MSAHHNLFIHLDTFHMSIEEDNLAAALRRARPYLFYFELDQNYRGLLSSGTIQFEPLIEILREMQYDGASELKHSLRQYLAPAHG